MKKLVSIILCVLMLASLACLGVFAAPEGEAINSADDFAKMKADGTYYLNADISISTTYVDPFTGTFDGNGHTVTITAPMFAEFDGVVRDLTIDGTELSGNEDLAAFALYTQAMRAYNVTNKVDITVTGATLDEKGKIASGIKAGGLVANAWEDTDSMIYLRNCKNYGKITVATDSTTAGGDDPTTYAGGLVGYCFGLNAKFCENYGDVSAFASPSGYAGGIVGGCSKSGMITTCNIEYCTSEANVAAGYYAGGIIGSVGASGNDTMEPYTVKYCTVIGDITGSYEAGGFIGYAYCTSASLGATIEVTDSIYVGTIYGGRAAVNAKDSAQYAYSSLFVAYSNSCYNTVQNCLAWGEIKTLEGETFGDNHMKVFMGCSSAKTPDMPIENVFMCDNNTTEWYSWASAAKNDSQKIKIEDYLNSKITRCTEDDIKNGAILAKLNAFAGDGTFEQTVGTDAYPHLSASFIEKAKAQDTADEEAALNTTEEVTTPKPATTTTEKQTTTAAPTTTPTPTTTTAPSGDATTTADSSSGGCGSVVALSIMAMLIPAAVVVIKRKEK